MPFESLLREDLIQDTSLLENPDTIKVTVQEVYDRYITWAEQSKSTTPRPAKNIIETLDLVAQVITDYEARMHTTPDGQVEVVYEKPVKPINGEVIALAFSNREPGSYAQSNPNQRGGVKNLRPIVREVVDDPDHPGYKRAVLGFWYDNTITMTCWARTNKAANQRALWLESLMLEYDWYFRVSGVSRFLYQGWGAPETTKVKDIVYYGRPIRFFVKTEKLWNTSQKTLEELLIKYSMSTS